MLSRATVCPPCPSDSKVRKTYDDLVRAQEERLKQEVKAALLANPKFLKLQAMANKYDHDPNNIEQDEWDNLP